MYDDGSARDVKPRSNNCLHTSPRITTKLGMVTQRSPWVTLRSIVVTTNSCCIVTGLALMYVYATGIGNSIWCGLARSFQPIEGVCHICVTGVAQPRIHFSGDCQISRISWIWPKLLSILNFQFGRNQCTCNASSGAVMHHNGSPGNILTFTNVCLDISTCFATVLCLVAQDSPWVALRGIVMPPNCRRIITSFALVDVNATRIGSSFRCGLANIFQPLKRIRHISIASSAQVCIHLAGDFQISSISRVWPKLKSMVHNKHSWKCCTCNTPSSTVMHHDGSTGNIFTLANVCFDTTSGLASIPRVVTQ